MKRFSAPHSQVHRLGFAVGLVFLTLSHPVYVKGYNIQPTQRVVPSSKLALKPKSANTFQQPNSNVQENFNSANPAGEPLYFRHPITYGQISPIVFEKVELVKSKDRSISTGLKPPRVFRVPYSGSNFTPSQQNTRPNSNRFSYSPHATSIPHNGYDLKLSNAPLHNSPQSYISPAPQGQGMYNNAGGQIQQRNSYNVPFKESDPLPPFRSIRTTLPGSTFMAVRGVDGSMRYAVEPNPLQVRSPSPIYSSPPTNIKPPQMENRQIIAFRNSGQSKLIQQEPIYLQDRYSVLPPSSRVRKEQFNQYLGPNPNYPEYIIPYQQTRSQPQLQKQKMTSVSTNRRVDQQQQQQGQVPSIQYYSSQPQPPRYSEYVQSRSLPQTSQRTANKGPSYGHPNSAIKQQAQTVNSPYYNPSRGAPILIQQNFGNIKTQPSLLSTPWQYTTNNANKVQPAFNEAVRKPQVNIQPTPYQFNTGSGIQDKPYYSQNMLSHLQGHRVKPNRVGLPGHGTGGFVQGLEWQRQQPLSALPPSYSSVQHQQHPYSTKPSGFGPRAYPPDDQNGPNLRRETYGPSQSESQKFNWQTPQGGPQNQGQGSQIFWPDSRVPGQVSASFRPSPRTSSPFPERSFGRLEAIPNPYASPAVAGYSGDDWDQSICTSTSRLDIVRQQWEHHNSSIMATGPKPNHNSGTLKGNHANAQPNAYVKLNETTVGLGGQQTVYLHQNSEKYQKESNPGAKKTEAPVLHFNRREMQIPQQSNLNNHEPRLHANNGTKEDHKPETDSAILQHYLQRAKQVLREHKSKQERLGSNNNNNNNNNSIPIKVSNHAAGVPLLRASSTDGTKSGSSSTSQPSPILTRKSNDPNPIIPVSNNNGTTTSFNSLLHRQQPSDRSDQAIDRKASSDRNPNRTTSPTTIH